MIADEEVACYLRLLHELVMKGSREFGKEEHLLLLISILIQQYGQPFEVQMVITGANGNTAKIKTGWIIDRDSDIPRLTTVYIDE